MVVNTANKGENIWIDKLKTIIIECREHGLHFTLIRWAYRALYFQDVGKITKKAPTSRENRVL